MAHHQFALLQKLILLLDDCRNDIYVHVDKKAKGFLISNFTNLTKFSKVIFIERTDVNWGGYSQIGCELALLKEAIQTRHEYYHLLSGVDLPIKSQNAIHRYFIENAGMEFLTYHHDYLTRESFFYRLRYYHLFQEIIGHRKRGNFLYTLNFHIFLKFQEILGMNRLKNQQVDFRKGATWFSITHDLANYAVSQEQTTIKNYRHTFCADEIFLHTLVWNSNFRDKICETPTRLIDWKRGKPYIFREEDFELLINSNCLWARKFSEEVDKQIVEKIYNYLQVNVDREISKC